MQNLPITHVLPQITATLQNNNRLILQAPPGAGKTTAVPLALLHETWLGEKKIIILEPRRLSARAAAARMASLLGEAVGKTVGYQIRDDRCLNRETKIVVVTEGIVTKMLQSDPALEDVALLIFDEFHERNLHGDLALALSIESQELLREDLKIMVMSATLNTDALSEALSHPPCISSEGKSYAVEHNYLERSVSEPTPKTLPALVTKTVLTALSQHQGSILVFLPGQKEIRAVEKRLNARLKERDTFVVTLFGDLNKQAQDRAIAPAPKGQRKVVLATNIAESSLTIDGVHIVVDAGLERVSLFNSSSGMNTLHTQNISQDAATQRSGRAGRQAPGVCYRLWHEHKVLLKHALPEILNSDLSPLLLELAQWGSEDMSSLCFLDLPSSKSVAHAQELLVSLGAMQGKQITAHGKSILKLGVHPRLGHMMLKAGVYGLQKEATLLAALLGEKDILMGEARRSVDLSERLNALNENHYSSYVHHATLQRVLQTAKRFQQKLKTKNSTIKKPNDPLALLLAYAYPDRIAKQRSVNEKRYLLSGGKGAELFHEDALFNTPYLVIANLDAAKANAQIYSALAIDEEILYTHFKTQIECKILARWNSSSQRVEAREITRLGALVLKERPTTEITPDLVTQALLNALKEEGLSALNWSKKAKALQERVNFITFHAASPKESFPDFSDNALLHSLYHWLSPYLDGITTFRALQKLDIHAILLNQLNWEQQQALEHLAPERFKVPSGSKITLDYSDPRIPTLSVRLQELFGLTETPKLFNNSVTITIELLSPAKRPMQVTKDLKSFWDNTYDEVKKELRGKYKRHYWPDNPYEAVATSKTKKWM